MSFVFENRDCMEALREFPDKYFELALVDPPYGIGIAEESEIGYKGFNVFKSKQWDNAVPDKGYFVELARVSKNQIIWGGNYFELRTSRGWIIWDKGEGFYGRTYAEAELAWTSFDCNIRIYKRDPLANGDYRGKIHPTQKPIALYKWLLTKYAKPGDKIVDTHAGSASSIIACLDLGFDVWGYELDKDYYQAACKRIADFQAQLKIF